jgi:hypothetical protein
MPFFRSFLRVVLVCEARDTAMRRCQCWISSAALLTNAVRRAPLSHQLRTSAFTAICTWHTVRSGFFPPQLLADPREEQVADRTEDQVSLQSQPTPTFPLVKPDFLLLVLETPLHAPTRKGHQQQRRNGRVLGRVAHEELHFVATAGSRRAGSRH